MKQRMRDETFFCQGVLFEVRIARELAEMYGNVFGLHLVRPHRAIAGLPVKLAERYDLTDPVIFASIQIRGEVGLVLVDGNHRMQWAARHGYSLAAVVLPAHLTPLFSSGPMSPRPWFWKKMLLTAKWIGPMKSQIKIIFTPAELQALSHLLANALCSKQPDRALLIAIREKIRVKTGPLKP